MNWSHVAHAIDELRSGTDAASVDADVGEVTGVAYDSRQVETGNVFVALKGQRADGAAFARQAAERGARVIVAEAAPPAGLGVLWVIVRDARLALGLLSASYFGHPSDQLTVVGITGTNGKTTTAHLLASILEANGQRCGVLGTVAYRLGGDVRDAARTTPEAPDLQRMFRDMVSQRLDACVMEVSSHALALHRVAGVRFAAGVFTNLTRDHLDFHEDMERYFLAKRRLFEMLPRDAPAIVNLDDPRGVELVPVSGRPTTYAVTRAADVTPGPLSFTLDGLAFDVTSPAGIVRVRSSLVGRPNVYNILAAVATATSLGVAPQVIERGLRSLTGVPGRFEVVSGPADDITVVVDYAHTDDALRNVLETARQLTRGRLIVVFGCGGDRDKTKRPLMGAVAGRLADVIVVTSDNPRSEEPARIVDDVRRGLTSDTRRDSAQRVLTFLDRREAIHQAVALAGRGDLVLVAGKGHEKTQVIGEQTLPFDDTIVARTALGLRRAGTSVA